MRSGPPHHLPSSAPGPGLQKMLIHQRIPPLRNQLQLLHRTSGLCALADRRNTHPRCHFLQRPAKPAVHRSDLADGLQRNYTDFKLGSRLQRDAEHLRHKTEKIIVPDHFRIRIVIHQPAQYASHAACAGIRQSVPRQRFIISGQLSPARIRQISSRGSRSQEMFNFNAEFAVSFFFNPFTEILYQGFLPFVHVHSSGPYDPTRFCTGSARYPYTVLSCPHSVPPAARSVRKAAAQMMLSSCH